MGDEGVDDLQGGVLLVDQPLVLDLGGQVLLCKGLLLRQGSQEGAQQLGMAGQWQWTMGATGHRNGPSWALLARSMVIPEEEYLNTFKIFNCSFQLTKYDPYKEKDGKM